MKTYFISAFLSVFLLTIISCNDDSQSSNGSLPPPSGIMTYDTDPIWLSDEQTILYFHYDLYNINTGTYFIDTSGKNSSLLFGGDTIYISDISPDGNWLLIKRDEIYKIKINGDSLTQLTFEGINSTPEYSPDGNWIAYLSNIGSYGNISALWIMNSDGSLKRKVGYSGYFSWYNNNINILTLVNDQNINKISILDSNENITLMNLKQVNYEYPFIYNIKMSPDNTHIYYYACHYQSLNFQIFSVNIDGSNLKKLTETQGYSFSLSPDGNHIAYCDSSPFDGRLWIMNKDGSNKKQLTFP